MLVPAGAGLSLVLGCRSDDNPSNVITPGNGGAGGSGAGEPMTVTVLVENALSSSSITLDSGAEMSVADYIGAECNDAPTDLQNENGVCFYIETEDHTILYDFATSTLTPPYIANANKLNKDIGAVTMAVIGHSHVDHSGGVDAFLLTNDTAKVHLNGPECRYYYTYCDPDVVPVCPLEPTGMQPALFSVPQNHDRWAWLKGDDEVYDHDGNSLTLPQGVHLLRNFIENHARPNNLYLKMIEQEGLNWATAVDYVNNAGNALIDDTMDHENVLVIEHNGGLVVFSGCSHHGIANIVETVVTKFPGMPIKAIFGGFHFTTSGSLMQSQITGDLSKQFFCETPSYTWQVARDLAAFNTDGQMKIYTGHCTGLEGFYNLVHCTDLIGAGGAAGGVSGGAGGIGGTGNGTGGAGGSAGPVNCPDVSNIEYFTTGCTYTIV